MACLRRSRILSARALWISETVGREYVTGRHVAVKLPSPRRTCLAASARKTLPERSVHDGPCRSRSLHEPRLWEITVSTNPFLLLVDCLTWSPT